MLTPYAAKRRWRLPARVHAALTGGAKAHRVPMRWVRQARPAGEQPACVFVLLAREGQILPHSIDHARAWHDAGFILTIVVIVPSLDEPIDLTPVDFAHGLALRVNRGYDFGAWAAAIKHLLPTLRTSSMLAIANDSVLGPSSGFRALVERATMSDADVIGLVESNELARHFQSFVLFFKSRALRAKVFGQFWGSVRSGDRQYVIDNYEIPMRGRFEASGLKVEALYPVSHAPWYNPTVMTWRALVAAGFPYLKIELLRTEPWQVVLKEWRTHVAQHGFDLTRLDDQIAALERLSPSPWAFRKVDGG